MLARIRQGPERPLWMLPEPALLSTHDGHPLHQGKLALLAGPERLETGWWDGRDCRRDYFIVRDKKGSTLWAFHEYKPRPGWYLHGLFA